MTITPVQLSHFTAVSALGYGLAAHQAALKAERSALQICDYPKAPLQTYIGRVPDIESWKLPEAFADYHSRNNLLAYAALAQDQFQEKISALSEKYGPQRIGVLLGTTTSGFGEAESAYQHLDLHQQLPQNFHYQKTAHPFATCRFLREYLHLQGPAMTIATACSSSAKAMISAHHWLATHCCDAVLVAGIDSLCLNVLYGFHSLGILSQEPCRPFDAHRQGLSLGEAAALIILERSDQRDVLELQGFGESTDGFHMSAPHPEGKGAFLAMQEALRSANLSATKIDYLNFHGTASQQNDVVEDHAVYQLFRDQVAASSTKGWMGHTLGAAGALEVVISALAIQESLLPGTLNTQVLDPNFQSQILLKNQTKKIRTALTNSFGFGGNNCSLVIGSKT